MTAPGTCPFHDLDPETTVWLDFDGWKRPYSAELACDYYHQSVAFQPAIDAGLVKIYEQIAEAQP